MAGYTEIEPPPISPQQWSAEHGGEEAPWEVLRAWRQWADRENAWIERSAEKMGGLSVDEMLTEMGYKNEPDQGKSVFSRFKAGDRKGSLEQIGKDAFQLAVERGHFTYDPITRMYYNPGLAGTSVENWQWIDPNSLRHVSMPKGDLSHLTGAFGGTPQTGVTKDEPRPYLKTPAANIGQGSWGTQYSQDGRVGVASAQQPQTGGIKPPKESTDAFGGQPATPTVENPLPPAGVEKKKSLSGSSGGGILTGDAYGTAA